MHDARDLAQLINLAGERLPEFIWQGLATKGQDPMDTGALRAAREDGSFSYRNARIAEIDGQVAGMVLGYALPDPFDAGEPGDHPAVVRPLVELESLVGGSWYINAIAVYERFRGRGMGTALMAACEEDAAAADGGRLSLIVASENVGAIALYRKLGFRRIASGPLVAYPGGPSGGEWWLMVRSLRMSA